MLEFFLGAFLSLGIIFVVSKLFYAPITKLHVRKPLKTLTQSMVYDFTSVDDFLKTLDAEAAATNRQSFNHFISQNVRVVLTDNLAYWIKDGIFLQADLDETGKILEETSRKVDIMSMDSVQLMKMSYIVDKLTEGKPNDNRSSGNSQF